MAERKVLSLLEAGARVVVIALQLTPGLQELAAQGRIEAMRRPYASGDLQGCFLAVAASDDPQVNEAVAREGAAGGILINAVDRPELGDFIVPSVMRRGELVIAISTSGLSPALARHLREELERTLGEEYGRLLALLSRVRQELHRRGEHPSSERWQQALDEELLALLRRGEEGEAEARLVASLRGGRG